MTLRTWTSLLVALVFSTLLIGPAAQAAEPGNAQAKPPISVQSTAPTEISPDQPAAESAATR